MYSRVKDPTLKEAAQDCWNNFLYLDRKGIILIELFTIDIAKQFSHKIKYVVGDIMQVIQQKKKRCVVTKILTKYYIKFIFIIKA